MKQISLRLDDELHKQVKYLLVELEKSFNEYVLELIKQDLEKRKK
jgi:predicted HicB family RNase H-like nuclease